MSGRGAQAAANEERVLTLFPRLRERYRQRAGTLSGGEQQMLAIGRALMPSPRLVMIDELSLGLMPAMVDICINAVAALKSEGIGILLVEQNTHRAIAIADHVTVLVSGRVAYQASGARGTRRSWPSSTSISASGRMHEGSQPHRRRARPQLRCKGWRQEAILRLLENNLENAEDQDALVIYMSIAKAARDWDSFRLIVDCADAAGRRRNAGHAIRQADRHFPHPRPTGRWW